MGTLPGILLGLTLGLRHALEPDHLAAVAATVARDPRWRRAASVGALWGLGHAITLLLAGGLLLATGLTLSPRLATAAEGLIGMMLVVLGLDVLQVLVRERLHLHVHEHDGVRHLHLHSHARTADHDHAHPGRRALLVGMAHGLAGSAALALLAAAGTSSRAAGFLFLVALGAGATAGMALVTATLSLPLAIGERRGGRWLIALRGASAVLSVAIGGLVMLAAATAIAG